VSSAEAEAEKEGIDLAAVSLTEGETYSSSMLPTLWLTKYMDPKIATELRNSLLKVRQWICVNVFQMYFL